ncbi:MAG: hypothetical protein ACE5HH_03300 [Candidatus Hydrothermarchaeales archaeon]
MTEEKVYCKKCGSWIVAEKGECPRCGYVIEKKSKKVALAVLLIVLLLVLIKYLL